MPGTIRYHTDEDVNNAPAIANALRQRGIDITTTPEARLRGATDTEQLAHATAAGRILITHDKDLIVLADQQPGHAGILYVRQGVFTIGQIVRGLVLIWELYESSEMVGHVEYLSQSHVKL